MLQRCMLFALGIVMFSTVAFAQNPGTNLPEHLKYYFVFRQLSLLNQRAVAADMKGEDGSRYRQHYKNFASLNDLQLEQLNQIANECLQDVALYDARIKQLVDVKRAEILGNKYKPGALLPAPSEEEKQIGIERDQAIRQAYKRLIDAFGVNKFKLFNEKIEKSIRIKTTQPAVSNISPRDITSDCTEQGTVHGISMIQADDGNIVFYTATEVDYVTYLYYDGGIEGLIYKDNSVLSSEAAKGGPITEVILTAPLTQETNYDGYGLHFLIPIYASAPPYYDDPLCFSTNPPNPEGSEATYVGCKGGCQVVTPSISLGYTLDKISAPSGQ